MGEFAHATVLNQDASPDLADAPASSGKYLIVWRKDADGVWRIAACAATANPNP